MAVFASIDSVYQRLKVLLNKQQLGFVTPTQFDRLSAQAQQEVFNEDIHELSRIMKYKIRNLETANRDIQLRLEENLRPLLVNSEELTIVSTLVLTNVVGTFQVAETITNQTLSKSATVTSVSGSIVICTMSSNTSFVPNEGIIGGTSSAVGNVVSVSSYSEYPNRFAREVILEEGGGQISSVNVQESVAFKNNRYGNKSGRAVAIRANNRIEFVSSNGISGATISYYKYPLGSRNGVALAGAPTWAYTTVGEDLIYNSSASIDFELPKHLEERIVDKIMSLMGMSLRDSESVQYAEMKEQKQAKE